MEDFSDFFKQLEQIMNNENSKLDSEHIANKLNKLSNLKDTVQTIDKRFNAEVQKFTDTYIDLTYKKDSKEAKDKARESVFSGIMMFLHDQYSNGAIIIKGEIK